MSKLIEQLEKIGTITPAPMGFGVNPAPKKAPSLTLVALSDTKTSDKNMVSCFNATIVRIKKDTKAAIKSAKSSAVTSVWGIWSDNTSCKSLETLKNEGGDFFTISNFNTNAEVLSDDSLGKIIVIPINIPEELCHSLEELPVDAIIMSDLEKVVNLTINDAMQIRSLRDLISKPILLLRESPLKKQDLKVIRDVGLQGIVLDLNKISSDDVNTMRKNIDNMPTAKNKKDQANAIIPRLKSTINRSSLEEDDDYDDDEEFE